MDEKLIKVLLIEDDIIDRKLVEQLLIKYTPPLKFTIESTGTLSGAIKCLSEAEYDIALVDLGLPDSSGIEAVQKLNEVSPRMPIVVLTGLDSEEVGLLAIKNGAADYLVKSQSLKDLLIRTMRYAIERKNTEEKIKYAAQAWRITFDSISDMVSIHDTDFKIVRVNKAFASALHTEPKKVIGKTCYEILHNTKQPCPDCPHMLTLKTQKPHTFELFEPSLGIHLGISTSPVFDEKGKIVGSVHIAKNITERRLAEENLRKANEKLKEYNELKDEFVSTVSHELRTPLSIIQSAIRLVLDEIPGKIVDKQKEVLTTALDSVKWLTKIVNSLLTLSKIESGKMDLHKEVVDICKLIQDTVSEYKPLAQEKGLSLNCELPGHNIDISLDPDKMRQVLVNLISNSIKFTSEGGEIKVTCIKRDEEVQFSVRDTGIGIAKEDMIRLFNKFTQFSKNSSLKEKGTGLGLAIVKKLVEMHDGRINVESAIGQGTTFTISLPLTNQTEEVEGSLKEIDGLVEDTLGNRNQ
jgi:PAS domain S-box-containing protein